MINIKKIGKVIAKSPTNWEALLPRWNRYGWLFPLCFPLSLPLWAMDVNQALKQQVNHELNRYQQQLAIRADKQQVEIRSAGATEQQACSKWRFERPQADEPPLGRLSYRVECLAPTPWTGRAIAEVKLWAKVVVASRPVERGTQFSALDLKLESRELSSVGKGPLFKLTDVQGKSAKRRLRQGDSISAYLLDAAQLVSRGDLVTLQINHNGFVASTQGTALGDGRVGERLKVQNNSSGKVLEGRVRQDGAIEVDFVGN